MYLKTYLIEKHILFRGVGNDRILSLTNKRVLRRQTRPRVGRLRKRPERQLGRTQVSVLTSVNCRVDPDPLWFTGVTVRTVNYDRQPTPRAQEGT